MNEPKIVTAQGKGTLNMSKSYCSKDVTCVSRCRLEPEHAGICKDASMLLKEILDE